MMKFGREATLQLLTAQVVGRFSMNRIDEQPRVLATPTLDLVRGIRLPDGTTVTNDVHSSRMNLLTPTGIEGADAITFSSAKARRLLGIFRELRPGHLLECHDVVSAVEEWDEREGLDNVHCIVEDTERIESGKPYEVFAYEGGTPPSEWERTHSALGTDSGRLLGLVAEGLMLTIVDKQTTLELYNSGRQATLTENMG
jgi:hypothetical protein